MIIAFDPSGLIFPEYSIFQFFNVAQTIMIAMVVVVVSLSIPLRMMDKERNNTSLTPFILVAVFLIAYIQYSAWNTVKKLSSYKQIGTSMVTSILPAGGEADIFLSDGSFFTNKIGLYPVTPVVGDSVTLIHVKNGKKYAFLGKQGFYLNRPLPKP